MLDAQTATHGAYTVKSHNQPTRDNKQTSVHVHPASIHTLTKLATCYFFFVKPDSQKPLMFEFSQPESTEVYIKCPVTPSAHIKAPNSACLVGERSCIQKYHCDGALMRD